MISKLNEEISLLKVELQKIKVKPNVEIKRLDEIDKPRIEDKSMAIFSFAVTNTSVFLKSDYVLRSEFFAYCEFD